MARHLVGYETISFRLRALLQPRRWRVFARCTETRASCDDVPRHCWTDGSHYSTWTPSAGSGYDRAEVPTDARFGAPDRVLSPHRLRDQFREVRSRVFLWLGRLGHSPSN